MTCSNQLSQRFGIFDLVDLVEKMTYEWKTTIMDILSIFFFSLASQEELLRVHVRASNDKLSSERQCSGPPECIGTWGQ